MRGAGMYFTKKLITDPNKFVNILAKEFLYQLLHGENAKFDSISKAISTTILPAYNKVLPFELSSPDISIEAIGKVFKELMPEFVESLELGDSKLIVFSQIRPSMHNLQAVINFADVSLECACAYSAMEDKELYRIVMAYTLY